MACCAGRDNDRVLYFIDPLKDLLAYLLTIQVLICLSFRFSLYKVGKFCHKKGFVMVFFLVIILF